MSAAQREAGSAHVIKQFQYLDMIQLMLPSTHVLFIYLICI
jgi:hypothetical protein